LVAILLSASLLLYGCLTSNQDNGQVANQQGFNNSNGFRGRGNFTGNLTDEQRTQIQQRMQEAITACEGKAENDSCQFSGPRGDVSGTCRLFNNQLSCTPARPQGRGNFTRGFPPMPGEGAPNQPQGQPN